MVDNKYDIVGIGNSIVDVITDVEDQFLNEHELRKGLMSLVDLDGIKNISEKINIKKNCVWWISCKLNSCSSSK